MIAVFAGCRYIDVGRWWWPALDAVRDECGITDIWHGACSLDFDCPEKLDGADAGVDLWARARGLTVRMFPAPWALYRRAGLDPKSAGMRRVANMLRGDRGYEIIDGRVVTTETVQGSPALVVCLPGGPGTQGTAKAREDRTVKARPGEFDTLSAMAKEGLMYNWAGVLWCLEKDPTP